ncbi:MAG: DUF1501 domain-containing protein [Acidobacteriota bacterium]|jgi:hypothetical protein|nr:DUF1501 domain-containing protein [Bryobacteraceae bacterium CoA2 C42]MCA2965142.1 DUF1501 domain-containing protein [Acidobacteriaceae bacterium]
MTPLHRRAFLGRTAAGFGLTALQSMLGAGPGLHHPARAKRVIFLYQAGGPSHLELFDPKPKLAAMHGQGMPESFTKGQQIAQLQGKPLLCFGPQHPFQRYGRSGIEISARLPHIGGIIDDLCLVRSLWTEQINHDPAHTLMNTGSILAGRPSMGSWAVYGLGTEAKDLPGYVVLVSNGRGGQAQPIAARQWSAGMLPSKFQGVKFQSVGDPVLYIDNPRGMNAKLQQHSVEAITALQRLEQQSLGDPEVQTRIAQYEMAFRMQSSVPGLMDFGAEPASVLEAYGAKPGDGSFASNCLLARRLAERGVRFIQLYHRDWDHHNKIKEGVGYKTDEVDRPTAALIKDLKQRGMLDDTLVIWGGEFGRTPMSQGGDGRDHHIKGFSYLMAGGGIKPGTVYGATDELGYAAVDNPVSVHDLHATMLHLLGINHLRLTVKYQGLDVRLTGISGEVVKGILA